MKRYVVQCTGCGARMLEEWSCLVDVNDRQVLLCNQCAGVLKQLGIIDDYTIGEKAT